MAKFNLKSVYSADKPYTVVEELNKFVDYIDNVEYVAPGEYTRLFRHVVTYGYGQDYTSRLKFISTRSEPYTNLEDFVKDVRKFYLDEYNKSPCTMTYTYSNHYYMQWFVYTGDDQMLARNTLEFDFSNTNPPVLSSDDITSVVSDVVTLL